MAPLCSEAFSRKLNSRRDIASQRRDLQLYLQLQTGKVVVDPPRERLDQRAAAVVIAVAGAAAAMLHLAKALASSGLNAP